MLAKICRNSLLCLGLLLGFMGTVYARISVVAAENFYGDVAAQIGGQYVSVSSIITNPNQDPHAFAANPSLAKKIATADVVVYNGIGYDNWLTKLIAADDKNQQVLINVGQLRSKRTGDNPHLWYDPATMPAVAKRLTTAFSQLDPAHQTYYQQQLQIFTQRYQPLLQQIATVRTRYAGTPVTATEPVFGYMAAALGLLMQHEKLQWQVMNDNALAPREVDAFENALTHHHVKVLFYNDQVTDPTTEIFKTIAKKAGVPVVGVSEIMPPHTHYVPWMQAELDALNQALS